jgi:SAM-dependent methyltransferase
MGVYVQYGCGTSCPDGWINFDASPYLRLQHVPVLGRMFRRAPIVFPDRVRYGDIVNGLPVADNSADGVYASHVLEHLALADFRRALSNTFRMLRPGGIFRLVVPDLESRARKYLAMASQGDATASGWLMRVTYLGREQRPRGPVGWARVFFGSSTHLWMWDAVSMTDALRQAGFVAIRRCHFNDADDPAFLLVEDAGRFYDPSVEAEECAIEARKPDVEGAEN